MKSNRIDTTIEHLKGQETEFIGIDSSWIFQVNNNQHEMGSSNSSPFDHWSSRHISSKHRSICLGWIHRESFVKFIDWASDLSRED